MNTIYKNITTTGLATTLIAKSKRATGGISKITISNNSADAATVIVDLFDGGSTVYYICKNIVIPGGAVLVLDDNLTYDGSKYNLRIYNTGAGSGTEDLTIIIK
tara:strand:- start:28 stop:339 length:312 start_codon:yes stop_codon:yes gene_type:complete